MSGEPLSAFFAGAQASYTLRSSPLMKSFPGTRLLSYLALASLALFDTVHAQEPAKPIAPQLQPFVDAHVLAGR